MNLNLTGKASRNLAALRAIDQSIEEIVCEAAHIAVYEFDGILQSWKRLNVEGVTFIVSKAAQGGNSRSYVLIVLNKQGLENFILDLANCKKAKIQVPYIMLKCSTKKAPIIFGLWLHSEEERNEIFRIIQTTLTSIAVQANDHILKPDLLTDCEIAQSKHSNIAIDLRNLSTSDHSVSSPATKLKRVLQLKNDSSLQNSRTSDVASAVTLKLLSPSDLTGFTKYFYIN